MTEEIEVSSFKSRKYEFRSDKGKRHNYPKHRKRWNLICQRQSKLNLKLNGRNDKELAMSKTKKFKGSPSMRKYWREQKRKQRGSA